MLKLEADRRGEEPAWCMRRIEQERSPLRLPVCNAMWGPVSYIAGPRKLPHSSLKTDLIKNPSDAPEPVRLRPGWTNP